MTLECSSFPSYKSAAWWSNISNSSAVAWSQFLQVNKIYLDIGTFETPRLAINVLIAGGINNPIHPLCVCPFPTQPKQLGGEWGIALLLIKQDDAFKPYPNKPTGHCCCSLKESCHFVYVPAYHPPPGGLWMQQGFFQTLLVPGSSRRTDLAEGCIERRQTHVGSPKSRVVSLPSVLTTHCPHAVRKKHEGKGSSPTVWVLPYCRGLSWLVWYGNYFCPGLSCIDSMSLHGKLSAFLLMAFEY